MEALSNNIIVSNLIIIS